MTEIKIAKSTRKYHVDWWRQWRERFSSAKAFLLSQKSKLISLFDEVRDAEFYFMLLERAVGWAYKLRIIPVKFDAESKTFVLPETSRLARVSFFALWTLSILRGVALFFFLFTNWKLYKDFFIDGIMSIDHVMGAISGTATGTVFVSSLLIFRQRDLMFRNLNLIPRAEGHYTDLFGKDAESIWNVIIWKVRLWLIGAYLLIPSACFVTLFCYLDTINLAVKFSSHLAVLMVEVGIIEMAFCLLIDLYATAFTVCLLYFGLMTLTTNMMSFKYFVFGLGKQPENRCLDVLSFYMYVYTEFHVMNQAFRKYSPLTVFILLGVAAMNYQVVNVSASLARFGILAYCAFCVSVIVSFGIAYSVGTVLSEAVLYSGNFLTTKKCMTARQMELMSPEERRLYKRVAKTLQPLTVNYGVFFKIQKDFDRRLLSNLIDYTTNFILTFKSV